MVVVDGDVDDISVGSLTSMGMLMATLMFVCRYVCAKSVI